MGVIRISLAGSFTGAPETQEFTALNRGHAFAVSEAIAYLTSNVLPEAIERDHELHTEGQFPAFGFKA